MKTAGYSGKNLVDKLGYKPGDSVFVLRAPAVLTRELKAHRITITNQLPATHAHIFFTRLSELEMFCERTDLSQIEKELWVCWRKKSTLQKKGIISDITEQSFRDSIIPLGWVDTKVASVDDIWSGLKFLRRRKLR